MGTVNSGVSVLPCGEEEEDIFPCLGSTWGCPLTCGSGPCKDRGPHFPGTGPSHSSSNAHEQLPPLGQFCKHYTTSACRMAC